MTTLIITSLPALERHFFFSSLHFWPNLLLNLPKHPFLISPCNNLKPNIFLVKINQRNAQTILLFLFNILYCVRATNHRKFLQINLLTICSFIAYENFFQFRDRWSTNLHKSETIISKGKVRHLKTISSNKKKSLDLTFPFHFT